MLHNKNKGMNKSDLVGLMSELSAHKGDSPKSKADCERALNLVVHAITHGLKKHGQITLIGFGTFKVTDRKARTGHNPKTGAKMQIKAYKQPAFKAGSKLKESVQ
jgi:DNA-binding protein HU-beta